MVRCVRTPVSAASSQLSRTSESSIAPCCNTGREPVNCCEGPGLGNRPFDAMLHVLRRLVTFLLRMWSFFIAIIRINVRAVKDLPSGETILDYRSVFPFQIQSYESVTYRSVLASPWLETRLSRFPKRKRNERFLNFRI